MAKIEGVHIPLEPKNLIINGAMDFWQRLNGATLTFNTATTLNGYSADMFAYTAGGPTTKNFSLVFDADVPTADQSGFVTGSSFKATMITGIPSFNTADYLIPIIYKMEGTDFSKINKKTVTLGFWAKATVAGVYNIAFKNAAVNRSYVTTFNLASANSWQFCTVTVTLDQGGTWLFSNAASLIIYIGGYTGATYQTASVNQWIAGDFATAAGSTNWMATNGNILRVTQVHMIEGSLGLGDKGFTRSGKNYQQELTMVQRYCAWVHNGIAGQADATTTIGFAFKCPVPMRAAPSLIRLNNATIRHQSNDFGNAGGSFLAYTAVADSTGSCVGGWTELNGFAGLTLNGFVTDRGQQAWVLADAGL